MSDDDKDLAVSIEAYSMRFGNKEVIRNLSFAVNQGEVFGFLGANGAGKTTTIRTLLGLLEPTGGTLLVNGKRYSPKYSNMLGYLPEERGLYRNEPVLETMIYFAILHGLKRDEARVRAITYLKRVGLADKASAWLVSLSGGQQQKIQLGVTILHEPRLMILDEPTEALDPVNRSLLMDIINEQRDKGATVMLVTHRMEEVEQLCDRILFLRNGTAAEYGTVDDIKDKSGKQLISVNFSGKLPANNKIYKIVKSLPHYAELSWLPGKSADDVLRFLASDDKLHITAFDVRRPSLNDIFLDLYKDQGANDG